MAGPKFSDNEREIIHTTVAGLWSRGLTHRQIAAEIGVSERQAQRYVAELRSEWKRSRKNKVDDLISDKLAESKWVKDQARAEWERSKQGAEKTVTKTEGLASGADISQAESSKIVETTKTVAGQCGDPRYLQVVGSQLEYEAKLLGLNPPTKISPTDPDGNAIPMKVIMGVDDSKL